MADGITLEVIHNLRHDLCFGHFVRRLEFDGPGRVGMFVEALLQFALGLAGAEDQNRFGVMEPRNDRVIVPRKLAGVLPLAGIIGRNLLGFEPAMAGLPRTPELFFRG